MSSIWKTSMTTTVPRSFAGYLQSKNTSEGFQKMKRRGVVLPPFQIEQGAARLVRLEFDTIISDLRKHVILASTHTGIGIQDASPENEVTKEAIRRIRAQLQEMRERDELSEDEERIRKQLSRQLAEAQQYFFADFFEDASERMKTRIAFALDKDSVFRDRLDVIRKGYLDTAMTRISEGKSILRKKFIGILEQWITGERQDLDGFDALMDKISGEAGTFSKFFARDQFSRFNKALGIASYVEAGAKWIRWVTVGDQRVRPSHRKLQGKIFAINDLPKEYLDYNDRCGQIPIFELTPSMTVTKGDGVSLAA